MSWGRAVEPPPAIYASGPSLTGRTKEVLMSSVEQVNQICGLALHGLPQGAQRGSYYMGCYNPRLDLVILIDPKGWPSLREWKRIREHEWAHARGWRHRADGEGTDWAQSLPPPGSVRAASAEDAARSAATVVRGEPQS